MPDYLPLVVISGVTSELPPGDSAVGLTLGSVTAGSGLEGGGSLATSARLDVVLAPNPSGLIYVGGALGDDGVSRVTSTQALASGNAALANLNAALASGEQANTVSASAIASGNAVYPILNASSAQGVVKPFVASSPIISGAPVGFDDANLVQAIRYYKDKLGLTNYGNSPSGFVPSSNTDYFAVTFDSQQNAFLASYRNVTSSNYGYSQVIRLDGGQFIAGTPYVFNSANSRFIEAAYSPVDGRSIIVYEQEAITAQISGYVVNFGPGFTYTPSTVSAQRNIEWIEPYNTFAVVYGVGLRPNLTMLKTTGPSISAGDVDVSIGNTSFNNNIDCVYDTANNRLYAVWDDTATNVGVSSLTTISGTTVLNVSPEYNFDPSAVDRVQCTYDASANKIVTAYSSNNAYPLSDRLIVASISGDTITYGPSIPYASRGQGDSQARIIYDSAYQRNLLLYRQNNTYDTAKEYLGVLAFTLSGYYLGETGFFDALPSYNTAGAYPSEYDFAVNTSGDAFVAGNIALLSGTGWVLNTPERIAPLRNHYNNYLGIAQNTVVSGDTVYVRLPGSLDATNSGLIAGQRYYLSPATSGLTTNPARPAAWSGLFPWAPVAVGAETTRMVLTDSL